MSLFISLLFGIAVGCVYALGGVKSPAPPIVALFGLLGIVIGEQGIEWLKKRSTPSQAVAQEEGTPNSANANAAQRSQPEQLP